MLNGNKRREPKLRAAARKTSEDLRIATEAFKLLGGTDEIYEAFEAERRQRRGL